MTPGFWNGARVGLAIGNVVGAPMVLAVAIAVGGGFGWLFGIMAICCMGLGLLILRDEVM